MKEIMRDLAAVFEKHASAVLTAVEDPAKARMMLTGFYGADPERAEFMIGKPLADLNDEEACRVAKSLYRLAIEKGLS